MAMHYNCLHQVEDPLDEMQESIHQQKASIDNLQATFEEKFEYLQDQFSVFTQNCEEPHEIQPMRQSVKKDLKRVPSLSSLNRSS